MKAHRHRPFALCPLWREDIQDIVKSSEAKPSDVRDARALGQVPLLWGSISLSRFGWFAWASSAGEGRSGTIRMNGVRADLYRHLPALGPWGTGRARHGVSVVSTHLLLGKGDETDHECVFRTSFAILRTAKSPLCAEGRDWDGSPLTACVCILVKVPGVIRHPSQMCCCYFSCGNVSIN